MISIEKWVKVIVWVCKELDIFGSKNGKMQKFYKSYPLDISETV